MRLEQGSKEVLADDRMAPHSAPLPLGQRAGLAQYRIWDPDLAGIVEEAREANLRGGTPAHAKLARQGGSIAGYTARVRTRLRVLGRYCPGGHRSHDAAERVAPAPAGRPSPSRPRKFAAPGSPCRGRQFEAEYNGWRHWVLHHRDWIWLHIVVSALRPLESQAWDPWVKTS